MLGSRERQALSAEAAAWSAPNACPARSSRFRGVGRRTIGYTAPVTRHLWIWLMLQLEAFDDSLIALDDDAPAI